MKLTREEFARRLRVDDGTSKGTILHFSKVQESAAISFENKDNFILMSPRQSGRTLAMIVNILYELYYEQCETTYVCSHDIHQVSNFTGRVQRIIDLNPTIFRGSNIRVTETHMVNTKTPLNAVFFVTPNDIEKIELEDRFHKRLIIFDAAFVKDRTPIFKLIQGWQTTIMETVSYRLDKFNSSFIKLLMDFNGGGIFKILKYNHTDLEYSKDWLEDNKKMYGSSGIKHFNREILLKWE